MSELGKLSKLIDAATSHEDICALKLKLLEQRICEVEDVLEEICMELEYCSDDTDSDLEETKAEIIIKGTTVPAKKSKSANIIVTPPPRKRKTTKKKSTEQ